MESESKPLPAPSVISVSAPNLDEISAKINYALQLKRSGHLSRGRRTLETSGLVDLEDPAKAAKVKSMFPGRNNVDLLLLPEDAPRCHRRRYVGQNH